MIGLPCIKCRSLVQSCQLGGWATVEPSLGPGPSFVARVAPEEVCIVLYSRNGFGTGKPTKTTWRVEDQILQRRNLDTHKR